MSDTDISRMDFKQLRNEVQNLRDELAIFKRKYEDVIYNLDYDNFGKNFVAEQKGMKAQLKITSDAIVASVSRDELAGTLSQYSTIAMTADAITSTVSKNYVTNLIDDTYETKDNADKKYSTLNSSITQNAGNISVVASQIDTVGDNVTELESKIEVNTGKISAIVSGTYTSDLLDNYFTGITIDPNGIKLQHNNASSTYNQEGLYFYDSSEQKEGWAIAPDATYGGVFDYYVNNSLSMQLGRNIGLKATQTGMSLCSNHSNIDNFTVDLSGISESSIKFYVLGNNGDNSPHVYANDKILATQDWVQANLETGGTATAVFG